MWHREQRTHHYCWLQVCFSFSHSVCFCVRVCECMHVLAAHWLYLSLFLFLFLPVCVCVCVCVCVHVCVCVCECMHVLTAWLYLSLFSPSFLCVCVLLILHRPFFILPLTRSSSKKLWIGKAWRAYAIFCFVALNVPGLCSKVYVSYVYLLVSAKICGVFVLLRVIKAYFIGLSWGYMY